MNCDERPLLSPEFKLWHLIIDMRGRALAQAPFAAEGFAGSVIIIKPYNCCSGGWNNWTQRMMSHRTDDLRNFSPLTKRNP